MEGPYYIGVDVGTSSVRAALVTHTGNIISKSTHPIKIWEPQTGFYEQSSTDIWQACCKVVKMVSNDVNKKLIHGLAFDATCSLVAVDEDGNPVTVSPTGESECNVVMWMDHRAEEQAARINATKHPVLKYVGDSISLEMQMPKLLWLKENLDECWMKSRHFFDLPDFLTWRATGSTSRSLCSLVCKWNYQASKEGTHGWSDDFLSQIGLQDLADNNYSKIGNKVLPPGHPVGEGLSEQAAVEMGLRPGLKVATSIIDAHAGGLGSLACSVDLPDESMKPDNLTSHLSLICGTSTCHMAVSEEALFVPGVWGPYYSAMVPGLWLNEGGQSATGKLVDHIVETHPAYLWVKDIADKRQIHIHEVLNEILATSAKSRGLSSKAQLTYNLHVYPDYHGNRSPLADPSMKGMMSGLTLASDAQNLAFHYLAVIQALAYGTRQIVEAMEKSGHNIKVICICGGLAKNKLWVKTHADATGLHILLPHETESVLLGSAILGACAANSSHSIQETMKKMEGSGDVIIPDSTTKRYHDKKYEVFLKMMQHQQDYAKIMQ